MSSFRTLPLTEQGSREVRQEMRNPPADTRERRATFERARAARRLLDQELAQLHAERR